VSEPAPADNVKTVPPGPRSEQRKGILNT
jgi:hypothetical protein